MAEWINARPLLGNGEAPSQGEPQFLTARQAIALVAFQSIDALSKSMRELPDLWPDCAALARDYDEWIDELDERNKTVQSVQLTFYKKWIASTERDVENHRLSRQEVDERINTLVNRLSEALKLADEEWNQKQAKIAQAERRLREGAKTGAVEVRGRRYSRMRATYVDLQHHPIPAEAFLHEHRRIMIGGFAGEKEGLLTFCDNVSETDLALWRQADAPDWGDLLFDRNEVEQLCGCGAKPAGKAALSERRAKDAEIRRALIDVYHHAKTEGMKPPNIKEVAKPVQKLLRQVGATTTDLHIEGIANGAEFKQRRRPAGPRVRGTLLPFSLEGWKKSGSEG